jgi:RnfABCDGE-type electron transport complex G subunit
MSIYLKYPLVLGLVAAVSGLALYGTYYVTADAIEKEEAAARSRALGRIFWWGFGATEEVQDPAAEMEKTLYTKVWPEGVREPSGPPAYFAVPGRAVGYNASVPVTLMVGFANPEAEVERAAGREGYVLLGWSVVKSEETPGLGEQIKSLQPDASLAELLTGTAPEPRPDKRTPFQRQFYNPQADRVYTAGEVALAKDGGPIDAISGATITSRAVVRAVRDARERLVAARREAAYPAAEGGGEDETAPPDAAATE